MAAALSDLHQAKKGVAVLVTCVVQTLSESDATFQERFLERLRKAYYELRDNSENDEIQGMELLNWTQEFLTGFDHLNGQGEPFLAGR